MAPGTRNRQSREFAPGTKAQVNSISPAPLARERAAAPYDGFGAYCTAKGGVDALTRSFAFELGRDGIRVNAIRPGFTVTEGNAPILALPGIDEELLHRVPMRRWAQPSDIADYALFLLSDQSTFITGTTTLVDGGLAMNSYPDINALAAKAMAATEQ